MGNQICSTSIDVVIQRLLGRKNYLQVDPGSVVRPSLSPPPSQPFFFFKKIFPDKFTGSVFGKARKITELLATDYQFYFLELIR